MRSNGLQGRYSTVCVVGLGYVGLPTAAALASRGIDVFGVDVRKHVVETVNKGRVHIVEPELDVAVRGAVAEGHLRAATAPAPAGAFLITVPTPFKEHHAPDLSYIEAASASIAPVLREGNLVILESTSPVGTTEQLARWLAAARPDLRFPRHGEESADVHVAYCPERVLPGRVMHELVGNDRIIGGLTPECSEAAVALYQIFVRGKCLITDARTAEMCKLTENAFRDVNIAFANELSIICDKLGIDVWELIRLANHHPRVNILQPGCGVGGHCVAVDPWFIVDKTPEEARLIRTAREVNNRKPHWVLGKVAQVLETLRAAGHVESSITIGILGLAFKPNIDDLRESPALDIAAGICRNCPTRVLVVEPNIERLPDPLACASKVALAPLADALAEADLLILLVAHDEFSGLPGKIGAHQTLISAVKAPEPAAQAAARLLTRKRDIWAGAQRRIAALRKETLSWLTRWRKSQPAHGAVQAPPPARPAHEPARSRSTDVLERYRKGGAERIIKRIAGKPGDEPGAIARRLLRAGRELGESGEAGGGYALALAALDYDRSEATLVRFFKAAQRAGQFEAACEAVEQIERLLGPQPAAEQAETIRKLKASPAYLVSALKLIPPRQPGSVAAVPRRICYVLHNSLPYASGGYATRSHGVALGLAQAGYEVVILTRPGFPLDKTTLSAQDIPLSETIDSVRYLRTLAPSRATLRTREYIVAAADALEARLREQRPELVMAASNSYTALPALIAARRVGLPFIYEVRGLWEITQQSRDNAFVEHPSFTALKRLETAVAENADHVFTLTEPMREELIRRGIPPGNIDLLQNSCDPSRFRPREKDQALAQHLGIPGGIPVIGYIGTFGDYEGLDDLASACALLKAQGVAFRLLMVGSERSTGQDRGPITAAIARIAEEQGFSPWLIMPGRVPHEQVESYYSLVDIAPFPRKPWPVCEMVSPMKPLEALAMEKAVVVSSVRALAEMIRDGATGLVFEKSSVASLAATLKRLIDSPELRQRLGAQGRKWVEHERTWRMVGIKADGIFKSIAQAGFAGSHGAKFPPQLSREREPVQRLDHAAREYVRTHLEDYRQGGAGLVIQGIVGSHGNEPGVIARKLLRAGKALGESGEAQAEYALALAALDYDRSEATLQRLEEADSRKARTTTKETPSAAGVVRAPLVPPAGLVSTADSGPTSLFMPVCGKPPHAAHAWSAKPASALSLDASESGLALKIASGDKAVYLTHNGSDANFTKLGHRAGIDVRRGLRLDLELRASVPAGVHCALLVLEYDESNVRSGTVRLPPNQRNVYRARNGVHRILLAVRLKGIGEARIEYVRIDEDPSTASAQATTPQQSVRGAEIVPAPASGTSLLHGALGDFASSIPVSNGCAFFEKFRYRVALIADVYMHNFYKDCFEELIYLSPSNYEQVLRNTEIDLFIYTTCWTGISNDEWRGIKYRAAPAKALAEILEHCKRWGIRTVFQSIEDPSNFEYFLEVAARFDYVFTADANVVARYKSELSHDRVFLGEFGVNPRFNNPIGCRRPPWNAAFFAGSYPARYPERCRDMEVIFDSIIKSGGTLIIADRNHGATDPALAFPARYCANIIPKFDHTVLQAVHKLFRYNLNFNSIKNSPTMCAMRVYELQAQGRAIISNYARSVLNTFSGIHIIPAHCDMAPYFAEEPAFAEYRANMACARAVLDGRTSFDVVGKMLVNIGLGVNRAANTTVAVIVEAETDAVRSLVERQTYEHKLLVAAATVRDAGAWSAYRRENDVGYFTYFSDADDYEPHYLSDLVNGFKYTASRYVTKAAYFDGSRFVDGVQHEYTNVMAGRARTLFAASAFSPHQLNHLGPHQPLAGLDGGYSIDPFELNYRRFERTTRLPERQDYALSVIVPVYNNGRFLTDKCIPSIARNKRWPEIEVILVDDGSSDPDTLARCESLCNAYSNVRSYYFDQGGSGSASRPRNKGIELASAPLIAFLDPDNEISPGGYDVLLRIHARLAGEGTAVGFVSGYQVKVAESQAINGKHANESVRVVDDPVAQFFRRGRFPVVSTQAAVIARSLFDDGRLRFVEGAVGQDSLFGWELLGRAGRAAFTSDAFLLYFAERAGSVTNVIGASYFEKALVLEREQVKRLSALGVLDNYVAAHFDNFFRNWYLQKLARVPDQDLPRCRSILIEIAGLYGIDHSVYPLGREAAAA